MINSKQVKTVMFFTLLIASSIAYSAEPRKAVTVDYPAVGQLFALGADGNTLTRNCTATLIYDQWAVTGNHCVLSKTTATVEDDFTIFFLDFGFVKVDYAITYSPYSEGGTNPVSPPQNDIALLRLVSSPNTITPLEYGDVPLNQNFGQLVGFAETGLSNQVKGLKAVGNFEYSRCKSSNYVKILCWIVGDKGVRAGKGDSGGALISMSGDERILTGIYVYGSGGLSSTRSGNEMWSTSMSGYSDWIELRVPEKERVRSLGLGEVIAQSPNDRPFVDMYTVDKYDSVIFTALREEDSFCRDIELDVVNRNSEHLECSSQYLGNADSCEMTLQALLLLSVSITNTNGESCDGLVQWKLKGILK